MRSLKILILQKKVCHSYSFSIITQSWFHEIKNIYASCLNIPCLEHVKPEPLSIKRQSLVQCLHELSLVKGSQLIVNGFISEEIDDMITFICSK